MRFYTLLVNIPVVYTLHSSNIPHDFVHRILTFPGDYAIGVSSEVTSFMTEKLRISKEKVMTVFNGVNPELLQFLSEEEKKSLREKWSLSEQQTVFAMHSRIAEVKNHMLVVNAIGMMSEEMRRRIVFVISGDKTGSYYNKITARIQELDIADCFRFVGWSETREILGISDYLISPSKNEGFPLTAIEAFIMKTPVIRTRTAGFDDQKYCIEIREDNPEDIVRIINDIGHGNAGDYKNRVDEAYRLAMKEFTAEVMAGKTVEVYKKALKGVRSDS